MKRFYAVAAALFLGSALVSSDAAAQCSADYVLSNATGSWQVNNAGGEGFGGWFVTEDGDVVHEDKPVVTVSADDDGDLYIGNSGALEIDGFHIDENKGGDWCGFTL